MKKKIIIFLTCTALVFGACASAQGECLLTREDGYLTYEGDVGIYILAAYHEGVLQKSFVMENKDGVYISPDIESKYDLKLCDVSKNQVYPASIKASTPTPPPQAEDGKTEYNPNNYPKETYDRAIDAYYAFSVIDSVKTTLDGNEICYEVTFANQGEIKCEKISSDVKILTAPDISDGSLNQTATELMRGDVVFFDRQINGEIRAIGLIMRPLGENYLTEPSYGTNFEHLISQEGAVGGMTSWGVAPYGSKIPSGKGVTRYAFGMSAYKSGSFLYLLNSECNLDTALEIELKDKTAVYVCDKSSKVGGIKIESISAIDSNISNKQFMTGGTISPEDEGLSYALVRLVDGVATDIVCYEY